jgi:hypothetical protein
MMEIGGVYPTANLFDIELKGLGVTALVNGSC